MHRRVGVRELRRDLSEYLRRVERGESFVVTSRGREVALLASAPARADPLARLIADRDAIAPRLDLLEIEPLTLDGGPPLSAVLDDVRADRQLPGLTYLDSSAIVKLVVEEAESQALRASLRDRPRRVSSALASVEVTLAAARREPSPPSARVAVILSGLALVPIDQPVLTAAAGLAHLQLRALNAIHIATVLSLGGDVDVLIAYDQRLLAAASTLGIETEQPT